MRTAVAFPDSTTVLIHLVVELSHLNCWDWFDSYLACTPYSHWL